MTSQSEKKQGITLKQLKSQKVLILLSIPFIIYVIIFCYVPLGGWLMAFQNYKPKTVFFIQSLCDLQNLSSFSQTISF